MWSTTHPLDIAREAKHSPFRASVVRPRGLRAQIARAYRSWMNQVERAEISDAEIVRRYRALRFHFVPRKHPRSYVPRRTPSASSTLLARASTWLLPWTRDEYPGRHKGIVLALKGCRAFGTLRAYAKGKRRLPEAIALMLADLIRARVEAGLALVAELEAYAARPSPGRRRRGFMRVDQATGLSGRGKVGKRRNVQNV